MSVILQHPSKTKRVGTSFIAYGRMSADVSAIWGVVHGPGWYARQSVPTRTRPSTRPREFRFTLTFINLPYSTKRFSLEIYTSASPDVPIITVRRLRFLRPDLGLDITHPLGGEEVYEDFETCGTTGTPEDSIDCIKMNEVAGEIEYVDEESGFWNGIFSSVPDGSGYTLTVSHLESCDTSGGQGDEESPITVLGIE